MNKQKKNATIFLTLFILSSIFVFIPIQTNAGNSIIFGNLPECFTSDKTCTVCEAIGMAVGIAKFILKFVGVLALLLFVWVDSV